MIDINWISYGLGVISILILFGLSKIIPRKKTGIAKLREKMREAYENMVKAYNKMKEVDDLLRKIEKE